MVVDPTPARTELPAAPSPQRHLAPCGAMAVLIAGPPPAALIAAIMFVDSDAMDTSTESVGGKLADR